MEALKTRYKAECSFIEEYGDCEMDHGTSETEEFEVLQEAIDYTNNDDDKITLQVHNPLTQDWEDILSFPVRIAKDIEIETDL